MTKKTHQQVVIISAQRTDLSQDLNTRLHLLLGDLISDMNVPYNEAKGVYKDVKEDSYVVIVNNNDELETLEKFAFDNFNQESILYQDVTGTARLIFKNGDTVKVGKLQKVNKNDSTTLNNYTELNGEIYTTERR